MNAADLLSIARVLAVVPVVWLIGSGQSVAALAVFVAAALTDVADGAAARRAAPTDHGPLLDPLADKVFVVAVAAALVAAGALPATLFTVVAGRELAVALIRVADHRAGVGRPADATGKAKTATEMGALALLIVVRPPEPLGVAALSLLWVAALVGLVALGTTFPRRARRPL